MNKKIMLVLIGTILPAISYAQSKSQPSTDKKAEQTQSDIHQKEFFCWKGKEKYTIGYIIKDDDIKQECRLHRDNSRDAFNPDYYPEWVQINKFNY